MNVFINVLSLSDLEGDHPIGHGFQISNTLGEIVMADFPPDLLHRVVIQKITQVVDTTGAGDAFNGAYLAARFEGFSKHVQWPMGLPRVMWGTFYHWYLLGSL